MIITGFAFHNEGKGMGRKLALSLTDGSSNYGPVRVQWKDLWHSDDPIHLDALDRVVQKLEAAGSENIEIKPFSAEKKMIVARNSDKRAMSKVYGFREMGDSDAARLTLNFPDVALEMDGSLQEAIFRQSAVNKTFREIHETYVSNLIREGFSKGKIDTRMRRLFSGQDDEFPQSVLDAAKKILQDKESIDNMLAEHGKAALEPEDLRLCIDLNQLRTRQSSPLDKMLAEAFQKGKVGSSDIEVRGWKQRKHEIALEAFKHEESGQRKGIYLGLMSSPETLPAGISYEKMADQHNLRIRSARITSELLVIGNHNAGYDQEKKRNPTRDAREEGGRIPGDGIYRPGIDNSEARSHRRRTGDLYNIFGPIMTDTMVHTENYFRPFTRASLIAASDFFRKFSPHYKLDFEKSIQAPEELEQKLNMALAGDRQAIEDIARYCGGDCDPVLEIMRLQLPRAYVLARAVGADMHMAFNASPSRLAKLYWDRKAFSKIGRLADADHREDENFIESFRNPQSLDDMLANTNILEDFDVTEVKSRLIQGQVVESSEGMNRGMHTFYAPVLARAFWTQISERDSLKELLGKLEHSDDPTEQIMCYRLLEEISAAIAIDLKKVRHGARPRNVFKRKFTKFPEEMSEHAQQYISRMELTLHNSGLVCSTGDLVFVSNPDGISDLGFVYLGQCNLLNLGKSSFIANFGEYTMSHGIAVPPPKKRFHTEPGESKDFLLETIIAYDFAHTALTHPELALKTLKDRINSLSEGRVDWRNLLRKLEATKDPKDYANQENPDVRLMRYFKMNEGDSLTYLVGSLGDEQPRFIRYKSDQMELFDEKFRPYIPYYMKHMSENPVLKKIANGLWCKGDKEKKKEAFNRILRGEGTDQDMIFLLQEKPRAVTYRQLSLI